MKTAIVIPARFASSRLPGKPLLAETGKYLIQHVYERAMLARGISTVVVATDDERIASAVRSFGGRVAMTRADHPSGTDRVAEVARGLDVEIVVNLQGDEPLIDPVSLEQVAELLRGDRSIDLATLAVPIRNREQWLNPACVKVVCDDAGLALYFSRSPIPFVRDGEPDFAARPSRFLQHVGLYAYRKDFLLQLATTAPAELENYEKLEQLRVLALGHRIGVGMIEQPALGVDTPEDYRHFVAIAARQRAA